MMTGRVMECQRVGSAVPKNGTAAGLSDDPPRPTGSPGTHLNRCWKGLWGPGRRGGEKGSEENEREGTTSEVKESYRDARRLNRSNWDVMRFLPV
ncbi:hypothetical protein E2C01_006102 [Portunus trituberculatus]|uniref:Uncharacterized protein n=1 Tax=Portunus trituberculatus TaxID=210409 RepID=A0A5B7CWZ6_PORTR|nr:hypothetical protein [Portunus trituberculatus]